MSTPSAIPEAGVLVREVVEHPRRPGRYRVTLEGGARYLLTAGGVAAAGATRVGVRLDAEGVACLEREAAVTDIVDRALASLARQRRSRRQLEVAARRRGADPAQVAVAMERLEAAGALDDRMLAEAESAARLRRGEAPARVRQRLRRKGVEAALVDQALRHSVEEEGFDERGSCEAVARRRWPALAALPAEVGRRRLAGFLLRRGYGGAVVQGVVRQLERERGLHGGDGAGASG